MREIDDYTLGWIAGIIDGEGSISLLKEKRPHFKAGCTYKPQLSVGNTDLLMLEILTENMGGSIRKANPKFREDIGKRPMWQWSINSNGMRKFLPILPLMTKQKQKILIIEALDILEIRAGKGHPRTDKNLKRLEEIYVAIRKINYGVWNKC